jgi:hypothetical protein
MQIALKWKEKIWRGKSSGYSKQSTEGRKKKVCGADENKKSSVVYVSE